MLDAKIASALNKIIQNSQFKKKVSLEKQKAQKEDQILLGRQVAFMIYDCFRVTGAHDTVLDCDDSFSIALRNDDVQDFDTGWDEILLSMSKIPSDEILECVRFQVAVSTWLLYRTFVLTPVCWKHVCLKACRLSSGRQSCDKLWATHGLHCRASVFRGCHAWTHWCAPVSRMTLWQRANPLSCWVESCWSVMVVFVVVVVVEVVRNAFGCNWEYLQKICTNWEYVSPHNSNPYWNCTTWRFIRRYRLPIIKNWRLWWRVEKIRNFDFETLTPGMGELKKEQWSRIEGDCLALKEEKVSVTNEKKKKGQCSKGDQCSFWHESNDRAQKPTTQSATPSEPSVSRGRSVSGKRSTRGNSNHGATLRQPCRCFLKGTCTRSPCEHWHPPECQF